MTWDDSDSAPAGRGFGAGRGFRPPRDDNGSAGYGDQNGKSDDRGFGSKGFGGRRDGDDGGSRGFGGRRGGDDDGGSRGFGGRRGGDDDGGSRGFGGGRRGGDNEGGNRGFGGRREDDGGNRGFGGGRKGGDEDGGSRGFGGGRRGGDDEGGSRGFGGGRRGGDDEGGSRGFGGGRRGGDDEGGSRGFGGGRKGGDGGEDGGSRGFGGGGRRGGDEDGGGRGFGGGGRRGGDEDGGGRGFGGGRKGGDGGEEDGEDKPRPAPYIPPEVNDDDLFGAGTSAGINFDKYDKIKVKVSGANPVDPITSFADAGLRDLILKNVEKSGYKKPTPIQKYSLPFIMAGRDLMACAQTGSGKTAGFLLPIINGILSSGAELIADGTHTEPHAIIMSPTRELTQQIFDEARKFALGSICTVAIAYGGTAVFHQAKKIMAGCHILVATPGRLNDFVEKGRITFSSVKYVVLDEGDRMCDMNFLPDMEKVMNHPTMPPVGSRQTLLFSATFPEEVQKLAAKFLQDYLFLAVGIVGGACSDVTQKFFEVSKFEKRNKLEEILKEDDNKVLVFVETKRNADYIAAYCAGKGFPTTSIHGDREQREREEALRDFKSGRMRVLVATSVGSRGLDIKNVAHVVNFDIPKSVDEYVHRIGRTGRVGNKGKATSFYDAEQDRAIAADLVAVLEQAEQEVPDFLKMAGSGGGGGFSGGGGFGGRDIRRDQAVSNTNANGGGAAEEEEGW